MTSLSGPRTSSLDFGPNITEASRNMDAVGWLKGQWQSLLYHNFWDVGIVDAPIACFLETGFDPEIKWLRYGGGNRKYIADPFLVERHGEITILMEEFDYAKGKGRIVQASLANLQHEPQPVIQTNQHMSYPYVFEHDGRAYCVPECCLSNEVALYSLSEERNEWGKQQTLIHDVPACDTTVIRYEGRWWLFFTRFDDNPQQHLYCYHSVDLHGPWVPHLSNPVKSDLRSSRPGGTPFLHAGDLYRPSQDLSQGYGGDLVLSRILKLNDCEFKEEVVRRIGKLSCAPGGIHTLSGLGRHTVIDSLRRQVSWREIPRMLGRKGKRLLGDKRTYLY